MLVVQRVSSPSLETYLGSAWIWRRQTICVLVCFFVCVFGCLLVCLCVYRINSKNYTNSDFMSTDLKAFSKTMQKVIKMFKKKLPLSRQEIANF